MCRVTTLATLGILFLSGCGSQTTTETESTAENPETQGLGNAVSTTPGDSFALNGGNAKVEFVATHVGDKPDPRKGGFTELSGSIGLDSGKVSSIAIEIDTSSLYTEINKLTDHLKSPDFFDVRQFPNATFKSTSITADSEGEVSIRGDLTLLGVTKEIGFLAKVDTADGGVTLTSSFEIDRTEFGMDFGPDKVEKVVKMTVVVGN